MRIGALVVGSLSLFVAAAAAVAAEEPALTNADVVTMVRSKLSTATIIEKINTSATDFQLEAAALADLADQGVPDRVIRAMMARQNGGSVEVAPTWREEDARKIWKDLVRAAGRCRALGTVLLFDKGMQFVVTEDSSACLETGMGFAVTWDQVGTICFKYVVVDNLSIGMMIVRTKTGTAYQIRGSQLTVRAMEGDFRFKQSRLDYRCE